MSGVLKKFGFAAALKWTAIFFIPASLTMALLLGYVANLEIRAREEKLSYQEYEMLEVEKQIFLETLAHIKDDLRFLVSFPGVTSFLEKGGEPSENIKQSLRVFGENHKCYDQIRILDAGGMERLRINFTGSRGEVVPSELLQNKASRYYVQEGFSLGADEIYVSPFDLNVEKGKLEIPFKPMIRFVMPLYSSRETLLGLGVLNYLGGIFLQKLQYLEQERPPGARIMILNPEGYWILGRSPAEEWGFMIPEREDLSFSKQYPEAWKTVQRGSRGYVELEGNLLFFCPLRVEYGKGGNLTRKWYLLSSIPKKGLFSRGEIFRWTLIFLGFILLLWCALFFGVHRFLLEKKEATVDSLTGIYNRRFLLHILESRDGDHARESACVALLDMGNFKNVNDRCGHEAGDEALRSAAEAMEQSLRNSDFVGRYGGDEFLVYLPETEISRGKKIMDRLAETISGLPIDSCPQASLVGDYGIVEVPREKKSLLEAVALADERMYANKNARKSREKEGL
ncbi:MAG TPA: GGDEF domain-containing protein [Synergistaceae bacterium]|nr:GGDEF domain-containing protein [Synergistaceae bacterium]HPJ25527.1 GGDEF domain-containing protein [Synergistaceae bacterium]HPQ36508.1 GGDEF domain-containing protein [Synergistaceae bacterium]